MDRFVDILWVVFVCITSVYYIYYVSLQSFMSIEQSVKEFLLISNFLFSHNSFNRCASTPFSSLCRSPSSLSCRLSEMQTIVVMGEQLGAPGAFGR